MSIVGDSSVFHNYTINHKKKASQMMTQQPLNENRINLVTHPRQGYNDM